MEDLVQGGLVDKDVLTLLIDSILNKIDNIYKSKSEFKTSKSIPIVGVVYIGTESIEVNYIKKNVKKLLCVSSSINKKTKVACFLQGYLAALENEN